MNASARKRLGLKRPAMSENAKAIIAMLIVFGLWAMVSEMDYQDAIASANHCVYRGL